MSFGHAPSGGHFQIPGMKHTADTVNTVLLLVEVYELLALQESPA